MMIIPIILLVAFFSEAFAATFACGADSGLSNLVTSIAGFARSQSSPAAVQTIGFSGSNWKDPLNKISFSLSIATNISTTMLVGYKFWYVSFHCL